jgi:hypothetical protein
LSHQSRKTPFATAFAISSLAAGTIEAYWPFERVIEVADKEPHGKVLVELYSQMASKPVPVDLLDLCRQLGIIRRALGVTFNNRAALASLRASIR